MKKYKVVIIEDNIPLGLGFKEVINNTQEFAVVSVYDNCEDAIENMLYDDAQIYLVDIELPGMNGVEGTREIKKARPKSNIIMVTVYENSDVVFDALCAGATGYLTKNLPPSDLVDALNETVAGGAPMSIKIAKMVVGSFQKKPSKIELSPREKEVLTLLSVGNSYDVIAEKLFISRNTIKFHLKNIYIKLQVNSNIEAVQKASKENLL
ncbi:response regulator transcription factor [Hyunsoonleella flava]|uniref:Response regulator transcription factor n=1 Tax=Hyunsoonleella flava TaxID=2527939 RepID=A0A4Q9FED7_9FLAO|nr:response regulator transcription factor [Hyunsoonleella flava]TBN01313.1 response regulator transcription factor [Hyunsoonleella flava]